MKFDALLRQAHAVRLFPSFRVYESHTVIAPAAPTNLRLDELAERLALLSGGEYKRKCYDVKQDVLLLPVAQLGRVYTGLVVIAPNHSFTGYERVHPWSFPCTGLCPATWNRLTTPFL